MIPFNDDEPFLGVLRPPIVFDASPYKAPVPLLRPTFRSTSSRGMDWQSEPTMVVVQKKLVSALFRGIGVEEFERVVGYTVDDLRRHIERQFRGGMTWSNHASRQGIGAIKKRVWHVDHIVPKRLFGNDDIAAAFALTNLRPLWAVKNMKKGARQTHLI